MNSINWDEIRFRASSWGNLLTESRDKKGFGLVCQKELIKIYNQVLYGRKTDLTTKQMDKGKQVEDESIMLFSQVEGEMYQKNQELLKNEWFTGHPDIYSGKSVTTASQVHDIKSSWSLDTFMPKLIEGAESAYIAQLNVYFDLTGAKEGSIAYCLVSAPANIVEAEKRKLLYSLNVATELAPEYIEAAEELEKQMIFDDIDYRERVIKIPVQRDDELIEKMKSKVPVLRQWLSDFHKKHMGLYPKS